MLFHSDILTQSQEQEIKFKLVNFTKQKKKKKKKERRKTGNNHSLEAGTWGVFDTFSSVRFLLIILILTHTLH